MARPPRQITVINKGLPAPDDFLCQLIAEHLAKRPTLQLVASDGKSVKKTTQNKRS